MSILINIKTEKCPKCGCSVVVKESIEKHHNEPKVRTHCNGARWETREFACGHTIEFIPNFMAEEEKTYSR